MAVLRLFKSDVLVADFPVGRGSAIGIGYTFVFKDAPTFRQENNPEWYKVVAGKSFKVVDIVIKYEWNNGGMARGLGSSMEYVVCEVDSEE